jgi:PAS domain S-box-containing protein
MARMTRLPIDQEAPFEASELFVSRTDARGIIQSGNDVFCRVAGFSRDELLNQPHNLIRHPDMPKTIFKLFWQVIQSGEVIAAYVKNMAKDGGYYWVLATVFPTESGFLSIRLKPTSSLLKTVTSLYQDLLATERSDGVEKGTECLGQQLRGLGFASYRDFMRHALMVELREKDLLTHASTVSLDLNQIQNTTALMRRMSELGDLLRALLDQFRTSSTAMDVFIQLKNACHKAQGSIATVFEGLECLSVNMSISANQLGKEGGTLSVVAAAFQGTATEILNSFGRFNKITQMVGGEIDEITLSVLCSRVQVEMLSFEIDHVLSRPEFKKALDHGFSANEVNEIETLLKLTHELTQKTLVRQRQFHLRLLELKKETELLHNLVIRLDLIRTGGKLEGSRKDNITELFRPFIEDMVKFIQAVDQPINNVLAATNDSLASFESVLSAAVLLDNTFQESKVVLMHAKKWVRNATLNVSAEGA